MASLFILLIGIYQLFDGKHKVTPFLLIVLAFCTGGDPTPPPKTETIINDSFNQQPNQQPNQQ